MGNDQSHSRARSGSYQAVHTLGIGMATDEELRAGVGTDQNLPLDDITSDIFHGHESAVYSCAFSSTGLRLATASRDRTVRIWNRSGENLLTLKSHEGYVLSCHFSPDDRLVVSGGDDKRCVVWDLANENKAHTCKDHSDKVYSCRFNHQGDLFASASCDKTIRLWDVRTFRSVSVLKGHKSAVFRAVFHPNDLLVASCSDDQMVRIWDRRAPKDPIKTLSGHTGTVWSCQFSPDGSQLVSASMDGSVRLWDPSTGAAAMPVWFIRHSGSVHDVCFAHEGRCVVSAARDCTLKIWDTTKTSRTLCTLNGHTNTVYHSAVHQNSVASVSSDDTVRLWKVPFEQLLIRRKKEMDERAQSSNEGGGGDPMVSQVPGNAGLTCRTMCGHAGDVFSCAFSTDGLRLASTARDRTLNIWKCENGHRLLTLKGHSGFVRTCHFSSDNRTVVSGSDDHSYKLWDAVTGKEILTWREHDGNVNSCRFNRYSDHLASASSDKTVRVRDLRTAHSASILKGSDGAVLAIDFHSNDFVLAAASASGDHKIRIWDLRSPKDPVKVLLGHTDSVMSCQFSPDMTQLVSCSKDGSIRLWDPVAGTQTQILQRKVPVNGVCFAEGKCGRCVVSGGDENTVKVWDARHGQKWNRRTKALCTLPGHRKPIHGCAVHQNCIASVSADETVRIWAVPFDQLLAKRDQRQLQKPSSVSVSHEEVAEAGLVDRGDGDENGEGVDLMAEGSEEANKAKTDTCLMCYARVPDATMLPCRHLCLCGACAQRWRPEVHKNKCPICRKPVENVVYETPNSATPIDDSVA